MRENRANSCPAEWLFGILLWTYPAPFRDEYSREMRALLRRRWREEASVRGPAGMALFGLGIVWDTLRTAVDEHALMLVQDLKFTFRTLLRSPLFALACILTIALGIGANTAIFSIVDHVLLRPLPIPESDQLLIVRLPHATEHDVPMSVADFIDWRSQNRSVQSLAAYVDDSATLTGAGEPVMVPTAYVTDGFFETLRVHPLLGRTFVRGDDGPGRPRTVVLSSQLWRTRFQESRDAIGKVILLDSQPHTVIGVMDAGFAFPSRQDLLWAIQPVETPTCRCPYFLTGLARMPNGSTEREVIARLNGSMYQSLQDKSERTGKPMRFYVQSLREYLFGSYRTSLLLLLGASTFVLVIACVNVANLLMARSSAREREILLRVSLGANTRRLVRQFLTESLVIASLGALAGICVAFAALRWYSQSASEFTPQLSNVTIDGRLLLFTAGLVVATGLLFGISPALRSARLQRDEAMRGGRGMSSGRRSNRARTFLILSEVALAYVLVLGAGLLIRSLGRLSTVNPGTSTDHLMTFQLSLPQRRYPQPPAVRQFYTQLMDRIGQIPGVLAAGAGSGMPPDHVLFSDEFTFKDRPPGLRDPVPVAPLVVSTPGYFHALGIPILRGRPFNDGDTTDAPPVAVISQAMARRYFGAENPIGRSMRQGGPDRGGPWMEIVGVAADAKFKGLDAGDQPAYYRPLDQISMSDMFVAVRTRMAPEILIPALSSAVASLDKDMAMDHVQTMEQNLAESVKRPRLRTALLTILAGFGLALAAIGVYAVVAYSLARRTSELGIRAALGALRATLLWLIIRQGMKPVLIGLVLGVAGAIAVGQTARSLLFGVEPQDPLTLGVGLVLLGAIGLVACLVPALRATRIDPSAALRSD